MVWNSSLSALFRNWSHMYSSSLVNSVPPCVLVPMRSAMSSIGTLSVITIPTADCPLKLPFPLSFLKLAFSLKLAFFKDGDFNDFPDPFLLRLEFERRGHDFPGLFSPFCSSASVADVLSSAVGVMSCNLAQTSANVGRLLASRLKHFDNTS